MGLILVGGTLSAVILLYFRFNPLSHSRWFMMRRFINWFPLGISYAFLYMARMNLNVSQDSLGELMPPSAFGTIFACGAVVYAISLVLNGPIVDQIGGKRGILIATIGACLANVALGFATYFLQHGQLHYNMVLIFSLLYSINMFFQSFGAVSIIKVKAYWFHVRERGIFGAIFGTLISLGVYLAFDWGHAVVIASKAKVQGEPNFLQRTFQSLFHVWDGSTDALWLVYFIPAGILAFLAIIDFFLIRDTPAHAGLPEFETHDASAGEMHVEFTIIDLLKRVFTNPILLMVCAIEFTNGVVRNGIINWYFPFIKQTHQTGVEFFHDNWGFLLFAGGVGGGYVAGHVSDKIFHSRRGPPVAMSLGILAILLAVMAALLFASPIGVGLCAVLIGFFTISIHSLMSGTAGADFGGRKATATAAGITDGFVYLGAGLQSMVVPHLTATNWQLWPLFLLPFAVGGFILATKMWQALPEATKRYLIVVEKIQINMGGQKAIEAERIEIDEIPDGA